MNDARVVVRWLIPIGWAAAMFASRVVNPWLAVGAAAIVLTLAVLLTDRPLIVQLFRPALKPLLIGIAAGVVMIAVTYAVFPLLVRSAPSIASMSGEIYAHFLAQHSRLAVLAFVIPVVIAEEIIWRGAFQETTAFISGTVPIGITATVYALAHIPLGSPLLVGVAFVCGLYWSALRMMTRSLIAPLLAHLAWDIALVLVPLLSVASRA